MNPHPITDCRKEINENDFQHFLSFIMSLLPYPVRSSIKKKNQLESVTHALQRQKADLEHKGYSGSLRTADHLILLAECINLADKFLRLCISKSLDILKLKSLAKGHLLLFTITRMEYEHFRKSAESLMAYSVIFNPKSTKDYVVIHI